MDKFQKLIESIKLALEKYEAQLNRLEKEQNEEYEEYIKNENQCQELKNHLQEICGNLELLQEYDGKNILLHIFWEVIKSLGEGFKYAFPKKDMAWILAMTIIIAGVGILTFLEPFTILYIIVLYLIIIGAVTLPYNMKIRKLRKAFTIESITEEKQETESQIALLEKRMKEHKERSSIISDKIEETKANINQCQKDLTEVSQRRYATAVAMIPESTLNKAYDDMSELKDIIARTREKKEGN